ncbi:hypothetical protein H310_12136 [Aphanomyces invadans]|uniref:Sestrin n=1 Tax=Aphanomyces invadans TaxID=157072 RepID=A0A024TKI8_9STRA|nr:hypothetical protein H310_12136 [Aphanomyces invadans]ETV94131.1 hypothetical protein H310_12136 [Aphanomyces invadans]|eukprot:XP_008877334.1 hypothetical protein H310_12136 [Aphanomyces invadans]
MYASRGDDHIAARKEWFFRRLLRSDARQRAAAIQKIRLDLVEMDPHTLDIHVPTLRRLARGAPLPDVRTGCRDILDELNTPYDSNDDSPVSYCMDPHEIVDVTAANDPDLEAIFVKCFLQSGRVSHLTRMLAWHTPYLKLHRSLISSIMLSDGPLPLEWRNYIALMAASEYRCHYVCILHQHYFLINGGDAAWLDGLDYVPSKLARLHSLNALLAHQPWLITSDDVAALLQTTTDCDGSSWSVSELVHAIVVMCMFHSISSIALGLGCVDEPDMTFLSSTSMFVPTMRSRRKSSSLSDRKSECSSTGVPEYDHVRMEEEEAELRARFQAHHSSAGDPNNSSDDSSSDDDDGDARDGSDDDDGDDAPFDLAAALSGSSGCGKHHRVSSRRLHSRDDSIEPAVAPRKGDLWHYCSETIDEYVDFDVRSTEYNVLHTEDFSWDEHCFSLVSRYFPGPGGAILEDLFKLTMTLTYRTYGKAPHQVLESTHPNQHDDDAAQNESHVDTTPFRHAIWYYVHRIYGICHDDYDYRNVNIYLNRPTKQFVKKVACTPWRVAAKDVEHFSHTLTASEKCHVTLLAAEARKQAGLMYGLRAVMQHFL